MLPVTHRLCHRLPPLNRLHPSPPPRPHLLILAALPLLRHPQPTLLEMVKDPQSDPPRRERNVRHAELPAHEEGARRIGLFDPRLQVPEELVARLGNTIRTALRVLQEAVESRNNPRSNVINPDLHPGLLVRVAGVDVRAMVWVALLEVLADDVGFVEGLG